MSAEKLARRTAANLAGVSQSDLRPGRNGNVTASERQFDQFNNALNELKSLDIRVDEHPNPSYERMLSHCLQVQAEKPIAFVGFDYLEKMQMDGQTEELRVSAIAQKLKSLAKRLEVPVITLSQYSRVQNPEGRMPQNWYLRYSGKIEQEAETIIHWFYPKYFVDRGSDPAEVKNYDPQDENAIFAVCGKQRDGKPMDSRLWVQEETGRFIDRYDEEDPF
jgi:replicative DNA helicase